MCTPVSSGQGRRASHGEITLPTLQLKKFRLESDLIRFVFYRKAISAADGEDTLEKGKLEPVKLVGKVLQTIPGRDDEAQTKVVV